MPKRLAPAAPLLAALLLLSGCLFNTTVDAKGGGTMHLRYRVGPDTKLETLKAQMQSADVQIEKLDLDKQNWVTADLKFADITKLSTTSFFKQTAITLADGPEKGTKTLSAVWKNAKPGKLADSLVEYYGREVTIEVTLPGEVVKTNAASHKGATAKWTIPMNDFMSAKEVPLSATYKVAAATPAK